jgi:hypothetical protein
MNYDIKSSEINNDTICEAVRCYSKVAKKVVIKMGSPGIIFLFLCDGCEPRFSSDQTNDDIQDKTNVKCLL